MAVEVGCRVAGAAGGVCSSRQPRPLIRLPQRVEGVIDPPGPTGVFWSPENSRLWVAAPSASKKDQSLGACDLRPLRSVA